MALIKCKECGQEISDTITTCPKCGYHMERGISGEIKEMEKIVKFEKIIGWINIIMAVVILIVNSALLVSYLYGSGRIDEMINSVAQAVPTSTQKLIVEMIPAFKMLIKGLLLAGVAISAFLIIDGGVMLRSAKKINSIAGKLKIFNNKM